MTDTRATLWTFWLTALAVLVLDLLDWPRKRLNLNLGRYPMWAKLLWIRLFVNREGYTYQRGMPARSRPMRYGLPVRVYWSLPRKWRSRYVGMVGVRALVPVAGGATIVGSRSGLFWKQTPGSLPVIQDSKVFAGNVFFVDTNTDQGGTTSGFGVHPDKALTTWDSSVALCTANQGDAVFILAGHTETISAADGVLLDVAGISFIGLGHGDARPTFTFSTSTAADIEVDSANEYISNMRFIGNIAALAAPVDVNAAGFVMEDCDWYVATATTDIDITIITDATADDMVVRRCHFYYDYSRAATAVTAASTEVIRLVGADRAVIEECYCSGNFSTSAINGITTLSGDVSILRNGIYNDQTADVAGAIDLVAGCTGIIAYNYGFHGFTTNIATVIDPSSCAMIENHFSNVVTETGGLVGTAST